MDYTGIEPSDITVTTFALAMGTPTIRSSNEYSFPAILQNRIANMFYEIYDIPEGHEGDWHFYTIAPGSIWEVVNGEWVERDNTPTQKTIIIDDLAVVNIEKTKPINQKEGNIITVPYKLLQTFTVGTTEIPTGMHVISIKPAARYGNMSNMWMASFQNTFSTVGSLGVTLNDTESIFKVQKNSNNQVELLRNNNVILSSPADNMTSSYRLGSMTSGPCTIRDIFEEGQTESLLDYFDIVREQPFQAEEYKNGQWVNRLAEVTVQTDPTPVMDSTNPVSSGGVYTAIENVRSLMPTAARITQLPDATMTTQEELDATGLTTAVISKISTGDIIALIRETNSGYAITRYSIDYCAYNAVAGINYSLIFRDTINIYQIEGSPLTVTVTVTPIQ